MQFNVIFFINDSRLFYTVFFAEILDKKRMNSFSNKKSKWNEFLCLFTCFQNRKVSAYKIQGEKNEKPHSNLLMNDELETE